MKLFLVNWGHREPLVADIAHDLEKNGHQVLYWIRSNKNFSVEKSKYPNTIIQDWDDAVKANIPTEIEKEEFLVPDKNLLSNFHDTELKCLAMLDRDFPNFSVMQKEEMYHQHFRLWWWVLNKMKIDIIVMPGIPHRIFDYLIYSIAQFLHLPVVMYGYTSINDRLYLMGDYKKGFLEKFHSTAQSRATLENLSVDIVDYYKRQSSQAVDSTPLYMKDQLSTFSGLGLFKRKIKSIPKSIARSNFHLVVWRNIKDLATLFGFGFNLKKEYKKFTVKPDYNCRYIYVPLHFQPECTTLPQGDVYFDQIFMVNTLASNLPPGWRLYVKEHISQWVFLGIKPNGFRAKDYYERLAKIPNVFLVPAEENSFVLLSKAQAVATATGTAGWEAVLRKVPALVFGFPWYMDAPGVFKITGPQDCANFFNAIDKGFKIEQYQIIDFLAFLDKNTFHAWMQAYQKKVSNLNVVQNRDAVMKSIITAFDNIINKTWV